MHTCGFCDTVAGRTKLVQSRHFKLVNWFKTGAQLFDRFANSNRKTARLKQKTNEKVLSTNVNSQSKFKVEINLHSKVEL